MRWRGHAGDACSAVRNQPTPARSEETELPPNAPLTRLCRARDILDRSISKSPGFGS